MPSCSAGPRTAAPSPSPSPFTAKSAGGPCAQSSASPACRGACSRATERSRALPRAARSKGKGARNFGRRRVEGKGGVGWRGRGAGPGAKPSGARAWFYGPSRKLKPPSLRLGHRAAELLGSGDPELDGLLAVCQCGLRGVSVSRAAWKLWHLGNESTVLVTPIDDDLVPVHQSSLPQNPPQKLL